MLKQVKKRSKKKVSRRAIAASPPRSDENLPLGIGRKIQCRLKRLSSMGTLKGVIMAVDHQTGETVVNFNHGEKLVLRLRDLTPDDGPDIYPSTKVHPEQPGFHQYPVQWTDQANNILQFSGPGKNDPRDAIQFKSRAEGVEFAGIWRITKDRDDKVWYAVDMWAKWDGHHYTLPSLFYTNDPRLPRVEKEIGEGGDEVEVNYPGMYDLSSDICAAMNRWIYFHAGGNVEAISDLRAKAECPVIHLSNFDELRNMIVKLVEMYDAASRNGGFRSTTLSGWKKGEPSVRIEANLTADLMIRGNRTPNIPSPPEPVNDGPPPVDKLSLKPAHTKKKRGRKKSQPIMGSVDDLRGELTRLQKIPKAQRSPDQVKLEKKIRAAMRARGKKGGARG